MAKWGHDVDARNKDGRTALHIAAENGDQPVVLALLDVGANPGVVGLFGRLGTFDHVILQSNHRLMTASIVHVTNLTPPGSNKASRAYGQKQLVTAGMFPCNQSDTPRE